MPEEKKKLENEKLKNVSGGANEIARPFINTIHAPTTGDYVANDETQDTNDQINYGRQVTI